MSDKTKQTLALELADADFRGDVERYDRIMTHADEKYGEGAGEVVENTMLDMMFDCSEWE